MKKIFLLLFLLVTGSVFSQTIDTANYTISKLSGQTKYTVLLNRDTLFGVAGGTIRVPIFFQVGDVDTSIWALVRSDADRKYIQVENKTSIYGIDSGLIRANLIYNVSSSGAQSNLNGYLHKDSLNGDYTFTGQVDFSGADVVPANPNLYHYPHEDSVNVFTKYNTFNDSSKFKAPLNVQRIRLYDQTASTYLQIGDSTHRNGFTIGSLNSSDGFDFYAGGVNVGWARNSYWSFGPGSTGLAKINLTGANNSTNTYTFYGDDNTGINRGGADILVIATGGSARITASNTEVAFNVPAKLKSYTTTERDALTPGEGWLILNSTTTKIQAYVGGVWVDLH